MISNQLTKKLGSTNTKFSFNSIYLLFSYLLFSLGAGLISVIIAEQTQAAQITFSHQGSGSGTLDGLTFSSSDFTITATGDTDDRFGSRPSVFSIAHDIASISIAGVGTFDFVTNTKTFINDDSDTVGFSSLVTVDEGPDLGLDLFDGPSSALLDGWDMLTSIGPVSASNGLLIQWGLSEVQTTGGVLFFNNQTNISATFQAVVDQNVPEPSSVMGLLGLGTLAASSLLKRKQQ